MVVRYHIGKMEELLRSFYQLTGIRIVVFSDSFRKVAEAPGHDSPFCRLIRANPDAAQRCHESDRYGCGQCRAKESLFTYTCHAGMTEAVAPIRYGKLVIGYLMFGQILSCPDMKESWEDVRRACEGYGLDMTALRAAYERNRPVRMEQLSAAAKILEACAGHLWLERAIMLRDNDLPARMEEYVSSNLHADLSVRTLCTLFGTSRSRLYRIFKEYFGFGVEQMVRTLRVEKSKELLETSDTPVSEIAARVGYSDYNYFIKLFRKETGVTPARFRKFG